MKRLVDVSLYGRQYGVEQCIPCHAIPTNPNLNTSPELCASRADISEGDAEAGSKRWGVYILLTLTFFYVALCVAHLRTEGSAYSGAVQKLRKLLNTGRL